METMYPGKVNSPATVLDGAIDDVVTTINVIDGSVLPDAPNIAVIGTGEDAETILYGTKVENALSNVTRGFQGTAKAWNSGTSIARMFTEYDYAKLKQNIENLKFLDLTDTPDAYDNGKFAKSTVNGVVWDTPAGEANTASNIGGQVEIYKQKTGVNLEFRTLKKGTAIDLTYISSGGLEIENTTSNGHVEVYSQYRWGQYWIADGSYIIDYIKLLLFREGNGNTVTLSVYAATVDGYPTGGLLGSKTIDCTGITTDEAGEWITFDLSGSNISIVEGQKYCWYLSSAQTSYSDNTHIRDNNSDVLANSHKIFYSGSVWSKYVNNDLSFKIYSKLSYYDYVQINVTPEDIKLDDLGTPDDNTDLNSSTSAHGLMPKLDNNAIHFINGQGDWAIPHKVITIVADDTTPDVSGGDIFITSENTVATKITDLDSPPIGQVITIIGGSNTNASTIPDGASINAVSFTGTGLDDATSGGTFTGTEDTNYKVEIDGVGEIDTFKWSDDGGATWEATTVQITGSAQDLNNGVTITFGATTGHTVGDYWTFTAYPDRFKLSALMTLNLDDSIMLFVKADNYYIELSRSAN